MRNEQQKYSILLPLWLAGLVVCSLRAHAQEESYKVNIAPNLSFRVQYGDSSCDGSEEALDLMKTYELGSANYHESETNEEVAYMMFGLVNEDYRTLPLQDEECEAINKNYPASESFDGDAQRTTPDFRRNNYSVTGINWKEEDDDPQGLQNECFTWETDEYTCQNDQSAVFVLHFDLLQDQFEPDYKFTVLRGISDHKDSPDPNATTWDDAARTLVCSMWVRVERDPSSSFHVRYLGTTVDMANGYPYLMANRVLIYYTGADTNADICASVNIEYIGRLDPVSIEYGDTYEIILADIFQTTNPDKCDIEFYCSQSLNEAGATNFCSLTDNRLNSFLSDH